MERFDPDTEVELIRATLRQLSDALGLDITGQLKDVIRPSLDDGLAKLANALAQNALDGIASAGHRLKGSYGQLGAVQLQSRALKIELAAKRGDLEGARAAAEGLPEHTEQTLQRLDF
ncbi:Hpt domain-containing protein [Chitinibacteraceae bacterium HSL-7]